MKEKNDSENEEMNENNNIINQGFKQQNVILDDNKIKDVLVILSNIAKDDSVAKANTIDKSKAVKKLLVKYDQNKASQADINKLKKIFYLDEYSQDREDYFYDVYYKELNDEEKNKNYKTKSSVLKKKARNMAIEAAIEDARVSVVELLRKKDVETEIQRVKNQLDPNSTGKVKVKGGDIVFNQVESLLKEVKEAGWDYSLGDGQYEKDREPEYEERRKRIIENIKKKKQDKFLKAFASYEKVNDNLINLNNAVDKMNMKSNDQRFGKAKDFVKQNWTDLKNKYFGDAEGALKEFLTTSENGANGKAFSNQGAFSQLGCITIALWNRIKNLESTVNSLTKTIEALVDQIQYNAKLAPEDANKVNKKFAQRTGYGKSFIANEDWFKLSNYEKFLKRFVYKDYSQNPPRAWWNSFSEEEKGKVLKTRQEWKKKRLIDLSDLYEQDQDKAIRYIDSFFYYEDKDKFGFKIEIPENLKNLTEFDEESKLVYDELRSTLENAAERNLVFNKVWCNNKAVRTKGVSALSKVVKSGFKPFGRDREKKGAFKKGAKGGGKLLGKKRQGKGPAGQRFYRPPPVSNFAFPPHGPMFQWVPMMNPNFNVNQGIGIREDNQDNSNLNYNNNNRFNNNINKNFQN